MKKTLIIALIALIITAGITSFINAQENTQKNKGNRPELTEEIKTQIQERRAKMEAQREEMQNVMENGTYEEWKTIVESRPKMTDHITAENFAKFQEIHKLKQAGNYEEAKELWEELGIEKKFGMPGIHKDGFNKGTRGMNGNCPSQEE